MSRTKYDPAAAFALQLKAYKLRPETELRFDEVGKWRFDYAFPALMLAVEIDGGTWTGGRHTRGSGYAKDCTKRNTATLKGWRVLNFTTDMVKSGEAIDTTLEALRKWRPCE
jgi:very-short-patch-repair endonuclease